jgi:hypothetical protein
MVSDVRCNGLEEHTTARRMSRSSSANLLSTTNLIVSLRMNMMIKMNMSSHDVIVIAVDLLSAVIFVARMARREVEGMNMVNLEPKIPTLPDQTKEKDETEERKEIEKIKMSKVRSLGTCRQIRDGDCSKPEKRNRTKGLGMDGDMRGISVDKRDDHT